MHYINVFKNNKFHAILIIVLLNEFVRHKQLIKWKHLGKLKRFALLCTYEKVLKAILKLIRL